MNAPSVPIDTELVPMNTSRAPHTRSENPGILLVALRIFDKESSAIQKQKP
jgi:hypothetical protein